MSIRHLNICAALEDRAALEPSRLALISPRGRLTVRELNDLSSRIAKGMARIGIKPGTRAVLMVTPGPEFMVLAFGLVKAGAAPVVVDPGIGWKHLRTCLAQVRPEAFVGVSRAHVGRLLFGWARSTVQTCVCVGNLHLPGWVSYRELLKTGLEDSGWQPPTLGPDQTAAIVFTSGSTGTPKGVVYTHRMFVAQARLLQAHYGIEAGEVDLATFPLFALFDPLMSVTSVFPQMDFTRPGHADPGAIAEAIERHGVTHMFGSPALLRRLGCYGERNKLKFPAVRRVLSAGAPVSRLVLKSMQNLLTESGVVFTPYGATEALPVCSASAADILAEDSVGRGVCVGRPMAGIGAAVIHISDEPIPQWSPDLCVSPGEIGEFVVWGENVSQEYFERPEADRLTKIRSAEGLIRHRMGDVGFMDDQGRLWFCGRKSHRVVTSERTLFTIPCESVFNQHPEVSRTALVGVGEDRARKAVLCVELEKRVRREDRKRIHRELLELGARHTVTRGIQDILFHPRFPVDIRHNAKIFREKLAVWAEGQISRRQEGGEL